MNALYGLLVNGRSRALVWGQASGSSGPSLAFFVLMCCGHRVSERGFSALLVSSFSFGASSGSPLLVSQWTYCLASCVSSLSFS